VRAEAKAAIVCGVGALLWFLPWLLPGKALLGTHPALFRPFEEGIPAARLAEIDAAAHPLYSDKLLQHDPEVHFSVDGVPASPDQSSAPLLPTWNPQVLGGLPHVATGLSSALYPLMWIAHVVPPPRCYAVIAALQTALCAWFAYLMLRSFHLRAAAAGCGALLFAASGWMSVHQEYFQLTAAATWLPLAVYGTRRLLEGLGGGFALGIAVACAFLSGFPQIAAWSLLAPALLYVGTVVLDVPRKRMLARVAIRRGVAILVPALLGLAIASPQLLATAELIPHSTRQALTPSVLEAQALPPAALGNALLPDLMDQSRTQAQIEAEDAAALAEHRGPHQQSLVALALAGDRVQRNNRFETTFAIGPAALLLALLGVFVARGAVRAFFVLLLAAGLGLALPGPVMRATSLLPGLNIGDPKRALLLVELALAALAAAAIERAIERRSARIAAVLVLALGALALGGAATWVAELEPALIRDWAAPRVAHRLALAPEAVASMLRDPWILASRADLSRQLLFAAGFAGLGLVAFAVLSWRPESRVAQGGLLVALAVPLAFVWLDATAPIPTQDLDAKPSLVQHFERVNGGGRIVRIGPRAEMPPWPPKLPMLAGVRDAQGYVAVYLRYWRDLLEAVDPGSTESVGARPIADPKLLERPLFDLLDVERAIAALPKGAAPPSPPTLAGWQVEPLDPPQPAEATYQLVVWRNPDALGRAHFVRKVEVVEKDADVLKRVAAPDFAPRDEAWTTALEASALAAEWQAIAPERGAERTLAYTAGGTPPGGAPPEATVELLAAGSDELQFQTSGAGGLLVQSDAWYPGWTVRVDGLGAPLLRVDHALRGVVVPPGRHLVYFHYRSTPLVAGLFLAPAALAVLVLASAYLGRDRAAA
jgi:hypothetical protein